MDKIKRYRVRIDPDKEESGVSRVSLVDKPAIETDFIYLNKQTSEELAIKLPPCHEDCVCEIDDEGYWNVNPNGISEKGNESPCEFCLEQKAKYDNARGKGRKSKKSKKFSSMTLSKEQKKVAGPFLIPDMDIYRYNEKLGEYNIFFTKEDIENIVEKFQRENNNFSFNFDHQDVMVDAYLLESWIVEDPTNDKSNNWGYELPQGTWFGVLKVRDDNFWNKYVKTGEVRGFSVEVSADLIEEQLNKKIKTEMEQEIKLQSVMTKDGKEISIEGGVATYTEDKTIVPAGEYELEDGTILKVGEEGVIEDAKKEEEEVMAEDNTEVTVENAVDPVLDETMVNELITNALNTYAAESQKVIDLLVERIAVLEAGVKTSDDSNVEMKATIEKLSTALAGKTKLSKDDGISTSTLNKFEKELNRIEELRKIKK